MNSSQRSQSGRDAPTPSQRKAPNISKQDTLSSIIKWLQACDNRASTISGEEKEARRLLGAVAEIWSFEKDHNVITGPEGDVEVKQTLIKLGKSIKQLEAKIEKKPTYAQAAQAAVGPVAPRARPVESAASQNIKDLRKWKTIVVKITNAKEKEAFRTEHVKDILDKLDRAMGSDRKPVGARRLPSGDLELHMVSAESRRWAESHPDWTKALAASAEITPRRYAVMAHAVRVADVNTVNQAEAIKSILEQNSKMHKNASIARVAWTKRALDLKKSHSSLIIETSSPATANEFIKNGLIFNHEIKTCEYFCKESKILQCFNCQKYGHVGKACRNPTRCGHCAGPHSSKDCTSQEKSQRKCASCGKPGHEAWSRECQDRVRQRLEANQMYANRPIFHAVEATEEAQAPASPRGGDAEAEGKNRKRARSICSVESDDLYGSSFPSIIQVESSAPMQQWEEVMRRGRSRSARETAKRQYNQTKMYRTNGKKTPGTQNEEEL